MIQNEMQSNTAQQHGFAGNVVEAKNLNDAVEKFAQASAADRSAFTKLTDTKKIYTPTRSRNILQK